MAATADPTEGLNDDQSAADTDTARQRDGSHRRDRTGDANRTTTASGGCPRMSVELSTASVGDYLRKRGVVPAGATGEAESLGGGVSNRVVRFAWEGGCLVVKQPLANLAVDDDWPADLVRVHNEADALRAWRDLLGTGDPSGADRRSGDGDGRRVRVPDVVHEDRTDHVVAVTCAPAEETWKARLLDGTVEEWVAEAVGDALGAVHRAAADELSLAATFDGDRLFEQLRLDPYHRTTAERHPDVADAVLAEAERVADVERTLVHGDYSPKNVLVGGDSSGGDGERSGSARDDVWIIDFEVAHWGDPAFDVAFLLNHLLIKSVYNGERHGAYTDVARAFFQAYTERSGWDVEADTTAELAVLMLARVDGKSPVEYVQEGPVADALRATAKRALREEVRSLDGYLAVLEEERDAR
jgi:5-methylthioribose kinase